MGAKHQPHYRIVVAEARSPRDGRFVESIGYYNPRTEPLTLKVDIERAQHWLSVGAQPTGKVRSLLVRAGATEGKLSEQGAAEGYVTEVPRYGTEPDAIPSYQRADQAAEEADESSATA